MITFFKANVSSSIATLVDYPITVMLVGICHVDTIIASITGTVCGGIVNFIIGRNWVFQSRSEKAHTQAMRYGIVWFGNLILNTSGVFVFTKIFDIHISISKIIVSLIVAISYNYVLQKKFVFKNN